MIDEFFVARLPVLVAPLEGALGGVTFDVDEHPLARALARALKVSPGGPRSIVAEDEIEIRVEIAPRRDGDPRAAMHG